MAGKEPVPKDLVIMEPFRCLSDTGASAITVIDDNDRTKIEIAPCSNLDESIAVVFDTDQTCQLMKYLAELCIRLKGRR